MSWQCLLTSRDRSRISLDIGEPGSTTEGVEGEGGEEEGEGDVEGV